MCATIEKLRMLRAGCATRVMLEAGRVAAGLGIAGRASRARDAARRGRDRVEAPIQRVAQRLLARVVGPVEAEPVRRVGERDLAIEVGEAERAAGARVPKRGVARPEAELAPRLDEPERERRIDPEHLVAPAARRGPRRGPELGKRLRREAELAPVARERRVRTRDAPSRPDPASRGKLEPAILAAVEVGDRAQARVGERLERDRARVHEGERHARRGVAHLAQRAELRDALDAREPLAREVGRQADVEVELERCGDLLGEEAPERPAVGVDPAQKLPLVPAEAHAVVAVARARLPQRPLSRDRRPERPLWEPGTRHGYHGVSLGWYEGELL